MQHLNDSGILPKPSGKPLSLCLKINRKVSFLEFLNLDNSIKVFEEISVTLKLRYLIENYIVFTWKKGDFFSHFHT